MNWKEEFIKLLEAGTFKSPPLVKASVAAFSSGSDVNCLSEEFLKEFFTGVFFSGATDDVRILSFAISSDFFISDAFLYAFNL